MPHTPGPWAASQILDDGRWGVVTGGTLESLIIVGVSANLTSEDAHLIAAAPDLLEALRPFADCNRAWIEEGKRAEIRFDWLQAAADAIAKAEGKTNA